MGWLDWIPGMGAKKNSNVPRNVRNAGANGSTMAVMNPTPTPPMPMTTAAPMTSAPTVGGRRRSMTRSRNGRKTMCRRHGRKRRSCRRSHGSSRKN